MSPCLHLAEAFLTEIHPLVCQSKSHIPMGTPNPSPFPYVQVTSNDPLLGWSSQNVRRFWASKSKSSSLVSIFQDFPVSNHQNLTCPIFNGIKPPKYIKVHQVPYLSLSDTPIIQESKCQFPRSLVPAIRLGLWTHSTLRELWSHAGVSAAVGPVGDAHWVAHLLPPQVQGLKTTGYGGIS